MSLDDELPAIQQGDAEAFARWMAGSEPALRDSLRSFATVVDTEAVLQEALLRVWQVAPRFVPDGKPHGLLRLGVRIGRNLAIDEVRKAKGRPAEDDELERRLADGEEPAAPDPLLRRAIAACREKLPPQPARALAARLTQAGGRSDDEVAAQLAMSKNVFLQNFTRARRFLRECLRRAGVDLATELSR